MVQRLASGSKLKVFAAPIPWPLWQVSSNRASQLFCRWPFILVSGFSGRVKQLFKGADSGVGFRGGGESLGRLEPPSASRAGKGRGGVMD